MRAWSTIDLYLNVWRLIDSEFDIELLIFLICSLISLLWSLYGTIKCGLLSIFGRKIEFYLMFSDNLCIVTLIFKLYNVLSTYALVILSLQQIPNRYMFYLNGFIFYLLLLILNCWGRSVLSVYFLKKRHSEVKFSWPIVYWVIDKGISLKMSSTLVYSVTSQLQLYVLRVAYLSTRMVLLKNVFEVRKSLFIMLLNKDICIAFF